MERPKYLYRFRSLADATQQERVRQLLVDHEVYLAPASSFNDPFDCCPMMDDEATETEYLAFWVSLLGTSRDGFTKAFEIARAMARREPSALRASKSATEEVRAGLLKNFGILCLNADAVHQLMWAHYGDSHRGICVQFDAQHHFFGHVDYVSYSPQRPTLNIFNQSMDEQVRASVLTKSDVWQYEGEWRLVHAGHVGKWSFPRDAITSVVVGARISLDQQALVRGWALSNDPPIPVFSASLVGHSYAVEIPGMPT
jgi:hypothetical protein